MDYLDHADITRHSSWPAFADGFGSDRRLILLTRHSKNAYADFTFRPTDTLILGRESSGVPDSIAEQATARIGIPMAPGLRSLNVALAGAMILGEAIRQTGQWPGAGAP